MSGPGRLFAELKRRHVFRAGSAYAVAAWILIEVGATVMPYLGLPDWTVTLLIVLAALGFPLVLIFAWAYDLTDQGLVAAGRDGGRDGLAGTASPSLSLMARRRYALAGLALVVLGSGVLMSWTGLTSPPEVQTTAVTVLPFTARVGPDLQYLGEGMVDLLSRGLEGAPEFRSVDPSTVVSAAEGVGRGASLDVEAGAALARDLGAGMFVLGGITEAGGRLRVHASLYDSGDRSVLSTADEEAGADDLFSLVDRLTASLLAGRTGAASAALAHSAARTTASLPALKAYLAGEQALRRANYVEAVAGYQRAVAEDSTFALAYYRLAVAAGLGQTAGLLEVGVAPAALDRAVHHARRLSDRDRALVKAYRAFRGGRADEAEGLYRAILRDHPDDMEARFQLGEVLVRYNPPRGRPWSEAKPYYESVLAVDPDFGCPI